MVGGRDGTKRFQPARALSSSNPHPDCTHLLVPRVVEPSRHDLEFISASTFTSSREPQSPIHHSVTRVSLSQQLDTHTQHTQTAKNVTTSRNVPDTRKPVDTRFHISRKYTKEKILRLNLLVKLKESNTKLSIESCSKEISWYLNSI